MKINFIKNIRKYLENQKYKFNKINIIFNLFINKELIPKY